MSRFMRGDVRAGSLPRPGAVGGFKVKHTQIAVWWTNTAAPATCHDGGRPGGDRGNIQDEFDKRTRTLWPPRTGLLPQAART
ncbi:MAG: hypothetical protein ACLR7U_05780 [Ruthenibacterium lactatiformans]